MLGEAGLEDWKWIENSDSYFHEIPGQEGPASDIGSGIMMQECSPSEGANDMSTKPSSLAARIHKTPEVIGGDACIGKTRIAVWMLVNARKLGMTDEEIRTRYDPPLSQADLDAAWEYYHQNREEIEQAIRENEEA